jgi:uncharacterized protein DUF6894
MPHFEAGPFVMPSYTFQVGNMATVIEAAGVDLQDNDSAREYAIAFVSELFQSRPQDFSDWARCSIQVLDANRTEVFATSIPKAAVMERDRLRLRGFWNN